MHKWHNAICNTVLWVMHWARLRVHFLFLHFLNNSTGPQLKHASLSTAAVRRMRQLGSSGNLCQVVHASVYDVTNALQTHAAIANGSHLFLHLLIWCRRLQIKAARPSCILIGPNHLHVILLSRYCEHVSDKHPSTLFKCNPNPQGQLRSYCPSSNPWKINKQLYTSPYNAVLLHDRITPRASWMLLKFGKTLTYFSRTEITSKDMNWGLWTQSSQSFILDRGGILLVIYKAIFVQTHNLYQYPQE